MGQIVNSATLTAANAAEWGRLLALLAVTNATAANPAPFKSVKIIPSKRALTLTQDVDTSW